MLPKAISGQRTPKVAVAMGTVAIPVVPRPVFCLLTAVCVDLFFLLTEVTTVKQQRWSLSDEELRKWKESVRGGRSSSSTHVVSQ